MKKKVLKFVFLFLFCTTISYTTKIWHRTEVYSDLLLENIEALAQNELPEVEITCGKIGGRCWDDDYVEIVWTPFGPYKEQVCKFVGYMHLSCVNGMRVY